MQYAVSSINVRAAFKCANKTMYSTWCPFSIPNVSGIHTCSFLVIALNKATAINSRDTHQVPGSPQYTGEKTHLLESTAARACKRICFSITITDNRKARWCRSGSGQADDGTHLKYIPVYTPGIYISIFTETFCAFE